MRTRFLLAALILASPAAGEDSLTFTKSGKPVARFTKDELRAKLPAKKQTFFDPHYGKVKSYDCLPIKDVMRLAYGRGWEKSAQSEAVLTAADGYASVSSAAKLAEDGGCLAVADAEFPDWEPVGRKKVNPGPYYLSWTGERQSTENAYPWPWQLVSINLVRFEDRYPEVVPRGAAPDSPAHRGFLKFKALCMRCHSINQEGGKIGPDLNAPQSITAYRPKEMIKAFIRQPSKFRYTEMPDHPQLTDEDLENLYQYFLFKSKQPEKSF
ncbi:MAG TPA: cytochrome c [Elusimicrobiota bacterium]|nr:cytochrome c [Elusimicrobiota bacterium]